VGLVEISKPMAQFKDSYVLIFHGSRRGGKTLSMVVQAVLDMLKGRVVYSNFKIAFNYKGRHYESQVLDYYSLLAQDEKYKDSCICWDETALWAYSRDSNATFNKILGLAITLIGKWEANLYCTVQFLNMVDKNLRQQSDAQILCTDLSFKYKNLERGSHIGQLLQDISGRFTGEMYEYSHEIYQRSLRGKAYWKCYNTKQTFDIFDAKRKVTLGNTDKVNLSQLQFDEDGNPITKRNSYDSDDAKNILALRNIAGGFSADGKEVVSAWDFKNALINSGNPISDYKLQRLLPSAGIEIGGNRYHQMYIIKESDKELFYV
jgi:hypothetical protein